MIKSAMSNEEEMIRQQEDKEEALKEAARVSRPTTTHSVSRPATATQLEVKPGSAMGFRPGTTESMKPQRTEPGTIGWIRWLWISISLSYFFTGGAEILKLDRSTPISPRKLSSARPLGTPSRPESRKGIVILFQLNWNNWSIESGHGWPIWHSNNIRKAFVCFMPLQMGSGYRGMQIFSRNQAPRRYKRVCRIKVVFCTVFLFSVDRLNIYLKYKLYIKE